MAKYVLIRGWLECSFEDVAQIRNLISEHWKNSCQHQISHDVANLYRDGWTFPTSPINWISLIFFGAHVKESSISFIFDCLSKIAESDFEIEGLFHVDDDDFADLRLWKFENNRIVNIRRTDRGSPD